MLLRHLVRDGDTGLPVTREAWEPRHPQERPIDVFDPQILRNPAPNHDDDSETDVVYEDSIYEEGIYE